MGVAGAGHVEAGPAEPALCAHVRRRETSRLVSSRG